MIDNIIGSFGMYGALLLVFLEYACFPFPSEVVLPLLGYYAYKEESSIIGVILLSTVISLIATVIVYAIGYYGGNSLVDKIYNKFSKSRKGIDKCKQVFTKYSNISVLFGRMIPLSRTYVSLFAGVCKQNLFSYIFYSFFGIIVWNTILIYLGFSFFDNLDYIINIYNNYKLLILIFLSVSIILVVWWKNRFKKR